MEEEEQTSTDVHMMQMHRDGGSWARTLHTAEGPKSRGSYSKGEGGIYAVPVSPELQK